MEELAKSFDPKVFEEDLLDLWNKGEYFKAADEREEDRSPYSMFMPPPNVTAALHAGHALNQTIQDIIARQARMDGFNVCWVPGTDHAGIATQMVVERNLLKEGISRESLGRDKFIKKVHAWRDIYGGKIVSQLKRMGCSCDWSREAYTMDPQLSKAVRKVFVELFNEGAIFRGKRLVNWDPELQTALSDDEIEKRRMQGFLFFIRYPLTEDPSKYLEVATTRPETLFGDTALAVHPDDERFKSYVGKFVDVPLANRSIPIIADTSVIQEFGTGCVKITPAHSPADFETGKKHGLPSINIFDEKGHCIDPVPAPFIGRERLDVRQAVSEALKEKSLLTKKIAHMHDVPHSERSGAQIEPRLSEQWFLSMKDLSLPAADAARSGRLRFFPENYRKVYLHWFDHIQDWCISRQLWWGHRIPVWHCQDCKEWSTGIDDPTSCVSCGSTSILQDEDVLDTWFSSWLWPLSTLGWPHADSEDYQRFYPSISISTAPEIIFLWVARMVMAGIKFDGRLPFRDVYMHATVCDKKGRKMSKTLGNGIDPLDIIEKYGADALRYTLVSQAPIGRSVRLDVSDFQHGSRFANKVWNASRFLLSRLGNEQIDPISRETEVLSLANRWILNSLKDAILRVRRNIREYRFSEALDCIYHFFWGNYCDWYLEIAKVHLDEDEDRSSEGDARRREFRNVLVHVLDQSLRLLHPFMPFVTEALWQKLPIKKDVDSICVASYPTVIFLDKVHHENVFDNDSQSAWNALEECVRRIRGLRSDLGIAPTISLDAIITVTNPALAEIFQKREISLWIEKLSRVICRLPDFKLKQSGILVAPGLKVFVELDGCVDRDRQEQRLSREHASLKKAIQKIEDQLANPQFLQHAHHDMVEREKKKCHDWRQRCEEIDSARTALNG